MNEWLPMVERQDGVWDGATRVSTRTTRVLVPLVSGVISGCIEIKIKAAKENNVDF